MTISIVDTPTALSHLRISESVVTEDEYADITQMCLAATEYTEGFCRRKWISQSVTELFTRFPSLSTDSMYLPYSASAITSITYYDTDDVQQTWNSANYRLVSPRGRSHIYPAVGGDWPTDCGEEPFNIEVSYTAGGAKADVPSAAKSAALLIVGALHEYREDGVIDNAGLALVEVPVSAVRLLSPYKIAH